MLHANVTSMHMIRWRVEGSSVGYMRTRVGLAEVRHLTWKIRRKSFGVYVLTVVCDSMLTAGRMHGRVDASNSTWWLS